MKPSSSTAAWRANWIPTIETHYNQADASSPSRTPTPLPRIGGKNRTVTDHAVSHPDTPCKRERRVKKSLKKRRARRNEDSAGTVVELFAGKASGFCSESNRNRMHVFENREKVTVGSGTVLYCREIIAGPSKSGASCGDLGYSMQGPTQGLTVNSPGLRAGPRA